MYFLKKILQHNIKYVRDEYLSFENKTNLNHPASQEQNCIL